MNTIIRSLGDIMVSIEYRKIKLIGHISRHNDFIKNIVEGKIDGGRGRPRECYFKDNDNCRSYG